MNKFFRLFLIISVYILVFASVSYAGFSDIENHWAKEKIENFLESGFVNGYGDGTFKPNQDVTRAEFCKIINAYVGNVTSGDLVSGEVLTEESGEHIGKGEDIVSVESLQKKEGVETYTWKETNLRLAYEKGYLQVGNIDDCITREEAFVALAKVMNLSNSEFDLNYEDSGEISVWAVPAVKTLSSLNYIKGYNGKINPRQNLTRAELVSVLYDFVGIGGLDDEPQEKKFEIGVFVHDEYGLTVKKIDESMEVQSGDTITFAVMLEDDEEEPKVTIISGAEYVELDEENLILDANSSGEAIINFTTDKHDEDVKIIVK